jgi:hypothetical protein
MSNRQRQELPPPDCGNDNISESRSHLVNASNVKEFFFVVSFKYNTTFGRNMVSLEIVPPPVTFGEEGEGEHVVALFVTSTRRQQLCQRRGR